MPITNLDTLIGAMTDAPFYRHIVKNSLGNTSSGQIFSHWTSTGIPAAGAAPVATEICTKNLVGAIPFSNATGGKNLHAGILAIAAGVSGNDIQFHDRLGHSVVDPTITTAQTINLDISGAGNNLVNRRGAADYSDVQWWAEWYVQTASSTTVTITYTNAAGQSGRTTNFVNGTNTRLGRMFPLIGSGGEYIRSVESVQLAGSAGAGSFGVTASRSLFGSSNPHVGLMISGPLRLGLPRIHDDACLWPIILCASGTTGDAVGSVRFIQG